MPMQDGKVVDSPLRPTPCKASLHQSNCGMPSRSIAGEPFIISLAFSSSVSLPSRSSARSSAGRLGFWYGRFCAVAPVATAIMAASSSLLFLISLSFYGFVIVCLPLC